MSRRGCKHGATCGDDLCPCEDHAGIGIDCQDYLDSGWRQPAPRDPAKIRADLDAKREAFRRYKSGSGGFRFGEGAVAQKEAQRRRAEIRRLERELEESE